MWTELIENPQALSSVFGTAPSLDGVRVTAVALDEGGPTVSLNVALNEYPIKPPARWRRKAANAVVLGIRLLGVEDLGIHGWTSENQVTFRFERQSSGRILVEVSGPAFDLRCSCGWIRVDKVSPYQRASGREYL
jgi:hypothetical protein